MRHFKISCLGALLALVCLLALTGCGDSGSSKNVLEIPEPSSSASGLIGTWTAQSKETTVNRYFYEDSKAVAVFQDTENETWLELAKWQESDTAINLSELVCYKYNPETQTWGQIETPSTAALTDYKKTKDGFSVHEALFNGLSADFSYKSGVSEMDIPNIDKVLELIDHFLNQ